MLINQILIPVLIFLGLGVAAGILLSVFSKIFAVKIDEQVEEIKNVLPGLNCGVCGFSGCANYADELVNNNAQTNKCVPGGDELSGKISFILGKHFKDVVETTAYVKCGGTVPLSTQDKYHYQGEKTCVACDAYFNGRGNCSYGCLGYGDCIQNCLFDAIKIVDGIALVNPDLCKGCAMCVKSCPKSLISIKDTVKKVYVSCSSCETAKKTMLACNNGCIGCRKCEKICPSNAITVVNNIANIDYKKCTDCLECVNCCPKQCIKAV